MASKKSTYLDVHLWGLVENQIYAKIPRKIKKYEATSTIYCKCQPVNVAQCLIRYKENVFIRLVPEILFERFLSSSLQFCESFTYSLPLGCCEKISADCRDT